MNELNDIAIYILSKEVKFNQYVQPACIRNSLPNFNSPSYTSGWGIQSEFGTITSSKLYNVRLFYYPEIYCQNVFTSLTKNWNSQICAGILAGGKDSCQGIHQIFSHTIKYFLNIFEVTVGVGSIPLMALFKSILFLELPCN